MGFFCELKKSMHPLEKPHVLVLTNRIRITVLFPLFSFLKSFDHKYAL